MLLTKLANGMERRCLPTIAPTAAASAVPAVAAVTVVEAV